MILIIRPLDCRYCGNGYYAFGHLKNKLIKNGLNVIDLAGDKATKENIIKTIQKYKPSIVLSFGHGSPLLYTAENEQVIFDDSNINLLQNKVWHTLSCLVGQKLGKDMIKAGGMLFSGYTEEWIWIAEDVNQDAYEDKYAKSFFASDNQIALTLVTTLNINKTEEIAKEAYNKYINYWLKNPKGDKYASEIIKWLIWDRDIYVIYCKKLETASFMPAAIMSIPVILGFAIAKYNES